MERNPTPHDWGTENRKRPRTRRIILALGIALVVFVSTTAVLAADLLSIPVAKAPPTCYSTTMRLTGVINATNITPASMAEDAIYLELELETETNMSGLLFVNSSETDTVAFTGVNGTPDLGFGKTTDLSTCHAYDVKLTVGNGATGPRTFFTHLEGFRTSSLIVTIRVWWSEISAYPSGVWNETSSVAPSGSYFP